MASDRFFPFYTGLPRFGVIVVYADRVLLLWLGNTPWRTVWGICHLGLPNFFRWRLRLPPSIYWWSKEHGLSRHLCAGIFKNHFEGITHRGLGHLFWCSIWVNVFLLLLCPKRYCLIYVPVLGIRFWIPFLYPTSLYLGHRVLCLALLVSLVPFAARL